MYERKKLKKHALKEQAAINLIKEGKPKEAEIIYRQLIADGNKNHIVFGNLGTICGIYCTASPNAHV